MMNIKRYAVVLKVVSVIVLSGGIGAGTVLIIQKGSPAHVQVGADQKTAPIAAEIAKPAEPAPAPAKVMEKRVGAAEVSATIYANPADVRKMISDTHDQYIADMRAYVSSTWPTWKTVQEQSVNSSDHSAYFSMKGTITNDIIPKIVFKISTFCDQNDSISSEEDRAYCHTIFTQPNLYQAITR